MGRRGEVAALPKGYSEGRGVFSQRFRGRREWNTERSSHLIFDTRPNCGSRGGSSGESVSSAAALTGPRLPEHQPLRPAPAPVKVVRPRPRALLVMNRLSALALGFRVVSVRGGVRRFQDVSGHFRSGG